MVVPRGGSKKDAEDFVVNETIKESPDEFFEGLGLSEAELRLIQNSESLLPETPVAHVGLPEDFALIGAVASPPAAARKLPPSALGNQGRQESERLNLFVEPAV